MLNPDAGFQKWHGRRTVILTNGILEATFLPGGGHLASWRFVSGASQENVLWESPWETADPQTAEHAVLAEAYGDEGVGEFTASFTGHALCLDGFGPPSKADFEAGVYLHGEAATKLWDFDSHHANSAEGSADLPVSGLRVERQFYLAEDESVLRVNEKVTNLRASSRVLHWVQHATVGAPFCNSEATRVTASVRDGMTWPLYYEGRNLLARETEFQWPFAPGAQGQQVELRALFTKVGTGFVAAVHQEPDREFGFVALCEAESRIAMGYVFLAKTFPWVTFWEENRARTDAPWNGTTQARGLEFGTTPFPLGNEAVDAHGPVLNEPVSRSIGPHETLRAPWILFLAVVPAGWSEIEDVRLEADEIVLLNGSDKVRLPAKGIAAFLRGETEMKEMEKV